jgi:hypothetical protein
MPHPLNTYGLFHSVQPHTRRRAEPRSLVAVPRVAVKAIAALDIFL